MDSGRQCARRSTRCTVWPDWAFLKFLAANFHSNVAKMYGDFLGNLENHHFLSQTALTYFLGNFWKNGLLLIPTSVPLRAMYLLFFRFGSAYQNSFSPCDTTWVIGPASFNLTFEIKKLNDLINAGNKFLQDGDQSTISFD